MVVHQGDTIQIEIIAMTTARIISQSASISNFMFAESSSTEFKAKKNVQPSSLYDILMIEAR